MTLVFAKKDLKGRIHIVADTAISDNLASRTHFDLRSNAVKLSLLTESVCLAFSGSLHHANQALAEFRERYPSSAPYRETIDFFTEVSAADANEFIVAFAMPGNILRMRSGKAEKLFNAAIGNIQLGFKRYQEGVLDDGRPAMLVNLFGPEVKNTKFINDMVNRMTQVIADRTIPEVGGFLAAIVSDAGRFHWVKRATLVMDPNNTSIAADGTEVIAHDFDSRKRLSVLPPVDPSVGALAFHYADVDRCFVFHSGGASFPDRVSEFHGAYGSALRDDIHEQTGVLFKMIDPEDEQDRGFLRIAVGPPSDKPQPKVHNLVRTPGAAGGWTRLPE